MNTNFIKTKIEGENGKIEGVDKVVNKKLSEGLSGGLGDD